MKLRFKENTLRLRLNQTEVRALASGKTLEQHVDFPGGGRLSYLLATGASASVGLLDNVIGVTLETTQARAWAAAEEVGIYFEVATSARTLRVSVEKDLECVDGPPEEYDPDAYPRVSKTC